MGLREHTTEFTRMRIARLARDGFQTKEIARNLGISPATVRRYKRAYDADPAVPKQNTHSVSQVERWRENNPPPKATVGELSPEAIECLRDLERFCDTLFPDQPLNSFQRLQARDVYNRARWEEHDLVEGPPRHGKSHVLAIMASCWRLAGGGYEDDYYLNPDNPLRDAEIILVSEAGKQVQRKFQGITARLESPRMMQMFGRFRSAETIWQESQGALMVEGRRREALSGDYSLSIVGTMGTPLGMGGDLIIVDDIASIKNCKDIDKAETLFHWLQTMIFSRLNAGGKIVCNGHRLAVPKDLYAFLEDMRDVDEWDENPEDEGRPMFRLIRYPAVVTDENGQNPRPLWEREQVGPRKVGFTLKMLAHSRQLAGPHTWSATWMQNPQPPGSRFCDRDWIFGSVNHVGCIDIDRGVGETDWDKVLNKSTGDSVALRLVTIDPSPTKYAAAICMDLLPHREYSPILLDIKRDRMRTLDTVMLLEQWWEQYRFTHLVLERNSAIYAIEDPRFQDFLKKTGMGANVYFHDTGTNKNDQAYGEQTIAADILAGRVRIPWKDHVARERFKILVDELTEAVATNDTRMALWFPKWNLPGLVFAKLNKSRDPDNPPPPQVLPPPRILEPLGVKAAPLPNDPASRRLSSVGLM